MRGPELIAELRRTWASNHGNEERFELCAALEQVVADAVDETAAKGTVQAGLLAALKASRTLADRAADALVAGVTMAVTEEDSHCIDAAEREVASFARAEARPCEALTNWPVELKVYGRVAADLLAPLRAPAVLVGIRTSGSYLAPLCAAELRHRGIQTRWLTVRPIRGPLSTDEHRQRLAVLCECLDQEAEQIVVIDDGCASGGTLASLTEILEQGSARPSPVYLFNAPVRLSLVEPQWRSGWTSRRVAVAKAAERDRPNPSPDDFFAKALADVPGLGNLDDVRVADLGPGYWQRFVAEATGLSHGLVWAQDHRRRKRRWLVRAGYGDERREFIARYVGHGEIARRELQLLTGMPGTVLPVGLANGYLLYPWLQGRPVNPTERVNFCYEGVVDYVHALLQARTIGVVASLDLLYRATPVANASPAAYAAAQSAAGRPTLVPLVRAPKNYGHWHFLKQAGNRLVRLQPDVSQWGRVVDIAEEVAGIGFELSLSTDELKLLSGDVATRCDDEGFLKRLPMACLTYAQRVERDHSEYDKKVTRIIEASAGALHRLQTDADSRRVRVWRWAEATVIELVS